MLFDIRIAHKYYTSGFSGDFTVVPSAECRMILDRLGWIAKESKEGIGIYAPVKLKNEGEENDPFRLKKSLNDDLRLTFLMFLNNSYFENFTDLPLTKEPKAKMYFNNLTSNPDYFLHSQSTAGEDDFIRIVNGIYNYYQTVDDKNTRLLQLFLREKSLKMDEETVDPVDETITCQFDMRRYRPGIYELRVDGTVADSFYLIQDLEYAKAYALIDIFTDVPESNRFIMQDDTVTPKRYRISFNNRKTFWRYKIFSQKNIVLQEPFIELQNDTGLFENSPDGSLCFISKNSMDLKEEPVCEIKLRKKVNGNQVTVIDNLPNAAIHQILPEKENDQTKIYSDIFIYL
jgi:hypothetical protein